MLWFLYCTGSPHLSHPLLLSVASIWSQNILILKSCCKTMKSSHDTFICGTAEVTNHSKTVSQFKYWLWNTVIFDSLHNLGNRQTISELQYSDFDYTSAENVFSSINEKDLTVLTVNTLMNAYIINKQYTLALTVYDKYLSFLGSQAWYHSAVRVCTQRQSVGDDTNCFDWVLCPFRRD